MRVITEFLQKNLIPHMLSFKVTQGHWNWQGAVPFPRLMAILVEHCKFFLPVYLRRLLSWVPVQIL